MNLRTFMESIESFRVIPMDPPASISRKPREALMLDESDHINRKRTLEKFFKCLIHGLDYLHSQLIRHKDIKPSNILVQEHGPEKEYKVFLAGRLSSANMFSFIGSRRLVADCLSKTLAYQQGLIAGKPRPSAQPAIRRCMHLLRCCCISHVVEHLTYFLWVAFGSKCTRSCSERALVNLSSIAGPLPTI